MGARSKIKNPGLRPPVLVGAAALLFLLYLTLSRGPIGPDRGAVLLLVWDLRDGQSPLPASQEFEAPGFSPTSGEFFLPSWASRPWFEQSLIIWRPGESGPVSLRLGTPRPWRPLRLARGGPAGPLVTRVDSEGRVNIDHHGEKTLLSPGDSWGAVWKEGSDQIGVRVDHRGVYRVLQAPPE